MAPVAHDRKAVHADTQFIYDYVLLLFYYYYKLVLCLGWNVQLIA